MKACREECGILRALAVTKEKEGLVQEAGAACV